MYIRSDLLVADDIRAAFADARQFDGQDIYITDMREFRPRGYARGFQLYAGALAGRNASAHAPDVKAATWDAYGYVMARLYKTDPGAKIASYANLAEFCRSTGQYIPRLMTAGFRALAGCVSGIGGMRRG